MKQAYDPPVLTVHDQLRDITAATSGGQRDLITQPRALAIPRLFRE